MAKKKGNQQKKGVPDTGSAVPNKKEAFNGSEINVILEEELLCKNYSGVTSTETGNNKHHAEAQTKVKHRSKREKQVVDAKPAEEPPVVDAGKSSRNKPTAEASRPIERDDMSSSSYHSTKNPKSSFHHPLNGESSRDDMAENVEFSDTMVFRRLRSVVSSILKTSADWLEGHKPLFIVTGTTLSNACHYVQMKIKHSYPIILRWIKHFLSIILLLFMVWLDSILRGIDSFLRMGTTLFFSLIWCSVLSVIAMVGFFKFLLFLAVAAAVGLFIGFMISILLIAISGIVLLWFHGSFWTTMLVLFSGGLAFALSRGRLALFIATAYSVYCAWTYAGWLGLFLAMNLSCISSEVLVFFLRDNINEQRGANGPAEQTAGAQGQSGFFSSDPMHTSSAESGPAGIPADRGPGIPSTSGSESEITSEDEILRLLSSTDHYRALGLPCFENVDVSVLKREYKKKAMLVHPDKNMGNEKAAEAFKKLQNAYEILLDSYKRKAYDDELRREELLNYFRRFQETSQKSRRRGFFSPGSARADTDAEDPLGESRRIACRKCGNFHLWVYTKKLKSRARWCQECKDFHQAKDGDGWVEQSSHPLFFGVLQKVDPPAAYVCADSKIYNATEWYICQGMRCPANSHKPSFHVNTNVTSKQSNGKGASSGQKGGGMPANNLEENMTEEEFFEWLQNAVQAGMFDNFSGSTSETPSERTGSTSKSSGGSSASGNTKRKKKGKK